MKYLGFLAGVFICFNGFGQSLSALDSANGFKEYTIGMKFSAIEKKLKLLEEKDLTRLFKVQEKTTINGMEGGEIELSFYRAKLVEISIFFQRKTIEEYDSLKHSFEQQYGTPKDQSLSENKPSYLTAYDKIFTWEGLEVGLQYNYDVSHRVIEIIYWGIKEKTEKSKEEF